MSGETFQLYDSAGQRKYLTAEERTAFLKAAEHADRQARTLCMTLAYTGCRISEALQLTADRVDLSGKVIVFESLKKRRRGLYRAVPVPAPVLDALDLVHGLREAQRARDAMAEAKATLAAASAALTEAHARAAAAEEQAQRCEERLQAGLIGSANQVEAVKANLEKRDPKFSDPD